jgi:hypothetical protein
VLRHCFLALAWLLISVFCLPCSAQEQSAPLDEGALRRMRKALQVKETEIDAAIARNEIQRIGHNEKRKSLDLADSRAVGDFNRDAERGAAERKRLGEELLDVRSRLVDLSRLVWLHTAAKRRDQDVGAAEARVKRTQALLERLGSESARDSAAIEAVAEDYQEADRALVLGTVELVFQTLPMLDEVSKALGKIDPEKLDLRAFPGEKWEDFREAVKQLRKAAAFLRTEDGEHALERLKYTKSLLQNAQEAGSATELDKTLSLFVDTMKFLRSELKDSVKAVRTADEQVELLRKTVEGKCGFPVFKQAALAFDLGEGAIQLWEIRGQQMLSNREVFRISDAAERRDRLLKEFSPGGTYYKTYKQDIELLTAVRKQRAEQEREIKRIETELRRDAR